MTSPSSSIVVVDKSGSVDASNLIQSSQHVHQTQHQPIRAQQVILNEDYLSGDNIVRAGNVNYLIPMPNSTAPMLKQSTISQHPNSKVHVISNVTLVSKADQPQPQTINFVNSKHVQQSSGPIGNRSSIASGNYVNISTKSQLQGKMFKSPTITQMDQQTHIVSGQQQPVQQQHIITKHLNNASAIVQKVIPRNILVSTSRIQNKIEPTTITRTSTPIAQHQTHQMPNVIQIQKTNAIALNKANSLNVNNVKSTKANQQSIKLVNQTVISGTGGATTATIKHGNTSAVKTITSAAINAMTNPNSLHQKNPTKTAYGIQNSKTPHQLPQQKSQLSAVHSNISTHSRNNNNNNNNTINANTKIVQHTTPRTIMSMNNLCVQPNVIGQKLATAKGTPIAKYMAQTNPSISNISQTPCMSTAQYRSNENLQASEQRVTTYRTIQPTEARPSSMTKSVTVINHPMSVNSESSGHQSTKKNSDWNQFRHRNGVDIGIHDFQTTSDMNAKSSTIPGSVDDVIMVNGTHMSEEMSARILQSLSQKVVFHSNNNANSNSTAASITTNRNVQPAPSNRITQTSTHRAIQPAPFKTAQTSRSYIEYANKSGPEYFRVNTSDIQSTTSTFVDNIPLISARGDDSYSNANDMDDDIIGEEVRPKPIDSSMDSRMQALHAFLQDHTYVQWPVDQQTQLTVTCTTFAPSKGSAHLTAVPVTNSVSSNASEPSPSPSSLLSSPLNKSKQSSTIHMVENIVSGSSIPITSQTTSPNAHINKHHQQSNTTNLIPGFPFGYNDMMNKDDDANSAISNGSRNKSDIDQGEETETAPEAGNEDDSVTRCICELTHDDGYMICCDKCSVWQHVDCMGIDRQNIPEEYKCELCQPRPFDQNRARTLQLMKRKEQQNFLMMKQSNQSSGFPLDSNTNQGTNSTDRSQLNAFSTIVANKKKGTLSMKSRKGDFFGASNSKRKRSDSSRGSNKRREPKKSLSKRKSHSGSSSNTTTPVKPNLVSTDNDKQSTSLRQWIENYEAAMTNHYSPELRARLHSITKQTSSSTSALPMLKNIGSLDNKCTTVPHAGGKILISTREIAPNNPVIEIRGKYMLSTQFKPQPPTNSPTSANGTRNFSKIHPGPFLFFYRLPNDGPEICVDTRTYGNEARFVRRSCRPNAEIVHSIEKGTPHLYIVSLNTIRSSTEITIKHEPHDLESLDRGQISAPTSTICGCGLIKDCMFGANSTGQSSSLTSTPTSSKKSKKPNGHIKDKFSQLRKRSKLDKGNRNQTEAASNSGISSNVSILSPTASKSSTDDIDKTRSSENALIKSHSLQEKVQKDQTDKTNDKPHRKNNSSVDGTSIITDQKVDHTSSSSTAKLLGPDSKGIDISNADSSTPSSPSKHEGKFDGVQTHSMKSPPTTPISTSSMKSPPSKSSHKKTARKSTCSLSEDTGDEYSHAASASKGDKESKKIVENKKLTREERKMEAIVRAFEKMEKTEQRKNEQNKHKAGGSTTHNSGSSSSSRKRNSSSYGKDDDKLKKSSSQTGKRRRKRGKSYSQSSSQKRKRNRFDSHNSEDGNTSDESSTPMLSPTRLHDLDRHPRNPNEHRDNMAAGLLLSLSNYGLTKTSEKNNCFSSPERYSATNKASSSTPPFAVSSACLLIEAAVGPLDNDFKLPTKAKTKKTIMNEWLHQSDGTTSFSSLNEREQMLSPSTSMDNFTHGDSNTNSYSHDEPRNMSFAAQKIEEFIHLTSGEHMDDDECSKWSGSPICTSSDTMTVPTPLPTPPLQMGSSVKKRWLRQAISEECSDDLLASSATSSPPNGFMAPLKKRRVVRQCSDLNAEDIPSPKEDIKDLLLEEETSESAIKEDSEKALQDNETKNWSEVDIKVETEQDVKEPKNETEIENENRNEGAKAETKPKEDENKSSMVDVDKFEPIESDEDEDMCEKLEIKTEVDDRQDKSIEAENFKQESLSEDSKSQDYVDVSLGSDEAKAVNSEDFDIDNSKTEHENNKPADSIMSNALPKNEIEDIQQKLHSFHSENLMILQSRNKKRASRATTPTSLDEAPNSSVGLKEPLPSSSSVEHASKIRKFSGDEREYKREPSTKLQNDDETSYSQYHTTAVHQSAPPPSPATTSQPISTTHTYSSYTLNSVHRIDANQPIPPVQIYQSPPPATPPSSSSMGFPNVNPQLASNMSTSNSLYHYLENPHRPSGFNTGYNTAPMFSIHTNVPPPTLLNSSNYLTKSYSTLSEPSTPVANISVNVSTPPPPPLPPSSSSNNPVNPKVLSRTQSADPRLNPQKDLPPITPKRKLSINEYRKRKQLTNTSEKPKVDSIEKTCESPVEPDKLSQVDDKPKNGMSTVDATKETVFSPAPTLLEMQQENLSKRLKSYKSLHEISSQIEFSTPSDSELRNEISTSISEAFTCSTNSSLTSVPSSPKSECDFDDAEINNPAPTPDREEEKEDESISTSTRETNSCDNQNDLKTETIEQSENDFDVEPADPPQCVNSTSAEAAVPNSEN